MRFVFRRYTSFRYVRNLLHFLKIPFGRLTPLQITCFNGAESSLLLRKFRKHDKEIQKSACFVSVPCDVVCTGLYPYFYQRWFAEPWQKSFRYCKSEVHLREHIQTWRQEKPKKAGISADVVVSSLSYYTCVFATVCSPHRGSTVVKVLCYKSEGRWIDSRWCHWKFFIDIIPAIAIWPWGQLSLQQKWVPGVFPGGKNGRCVRLTTLTPPWAIVT